MEAADTTIPSSSGVVPRRRYGTTGVEVSMLALGGFFDAAANPQLLERALSLGVDYWEVTLRFGAPGFGAFFAHRPEARREVFVLGKAKSPEPAELEASLGALLDQLGGTQVEVFAIQQLSDPSLLTRDVMRWAERAKASGRIRHFGFSTHRNMAACLREAAGLGWIDAIVTTYNYRLMQDASMQTAIDACAARGIALTAIKSQARPSNPDATIGEESAQALAVLEPYLRDGASPEQARLRAIWADERIASVCSLMPTESILEANARAALASRPR